ncbi:D-hexose-6-phosphate mutarotase [Thalassotalea euphylliae]|uniref:D-hexose-6-phosphate mutarotase n=1 Tax=Thalassotalea euphylliae TaxID=1655234 RepID=UPI003628CFF8
MNLIFENAYAEVMKAPLGEALEQLDIAHHNCKARLSLYGGHVLSWQPLNEDEVFWLSSETAYQEGKAIRGGVPLCWPWFGPYKDAGNHGFARQSQWHLDEISADELGVNVELSWQGENVHPHWPYKAKVVQQLFFGKQFSQRLIVKNLGKDSFEYTGALHSYFATGHPSQVTVATLDNVPFDCKLSRQKQQQDVLKNCVGPIDRVYHSKDEMVISDKAYKRQIVLTPEHVNQWVLWNPGKEIAATMQDIHLGGENEYVCLEAANTEWQQVEAGKTVTFGQTVSIKALSAI